MKDFFDLRALAREGVVDANLLGDAIAATFARRNTVVPDGVPAGLGDDFARDPSTRAQWNAFLARNGLDAPPIAEVLADVRDFALEPLRQARIKSRGAGHDTRSG